MLNRLVALAALFGLLFGYDEGSISGALGLISNTFDIDALYEGAMTSAVPLGAVGGVIVAAFYADRLGRRRVLLFCAVMFTIGAVVSGLSPSFDILTGARLLLGLAIGASSMVAPMYLAELAPAGKRGAVVFTFQLLITIGIMAAYLSDALLSPEGAWRWMLALGAVPAAIALLGLMSAPESPRWLARHGRVDDARAVIEACQPDLSRDEVDAMLAGIGATGERHAKTVRLAMFFRPQYRFATLFAIFSFVFPALVGINAVIYYAPTILGDTDAASTRTHLLATIGIGTVNVVFTVVSMMLIDRVGRRPLMICGFLGTSASMALIVLALGLGADDAGTLTIIGLFLFIAFFAVSLGPLPYLYMTEMFPFSFRSKGMAMATAGNWFFNFAVVLLLPDLLTIVGPAATFGIFLAFCLIGAVVAVLYAPETKGASLEDLEERLTSKPPA